jgi:hypothetical protein
MHNICSVVYESLPVRYVERTMINIVILRTERVPNLFADVPWRRRPGAAMIWTGARIDSFRKLAFLPVSNHDFHAEC